MPFATKPIDHWKETAAILPSSPFMRGLEPDNYVLDIGCGMLRNGVVLIDYLNPGRYFGFDKEPDYWEHDPSFEHCCVPCLLKKWEHKNPHVWRTEGLDLSPAMGMQFHRVLSFSVLLHMPPETVQRLMRLIAPKMAYDTIWLATVNIGDHDEGSIHEDRAGELANARRPFEWYAALARNCELIASTEPQWTGPNGRTVDVISFRRA